MDSTGPAEGIPDRLFFRIGDVAEIVGVKPYVLRYWETEFSFLSPDKSASGQRVYKRSDVETLLMIKRLLYTERYSIEGARRRIRELKRGGGLKNFRQEAARQALVPSFLDEAVPGEVAEDSLGNTFGAGAERGLAGGDPGECAAALDEASARYLEGREDGAVIKAEQAQRIREIADEIEALVSGPELERLFRY